MILGGIPVMALSFYKQDLAVSGHLGELSLADWAGLFYTSVFGSAIATGLFFYNATKGTVCCIDLSLCKCLTDTGSNLTIFVFPLSSCL